KRPSLKGRRRRAGKFALTMEDGVRLLELARNARQLFARQAPGEKKRLLVGLHVGRRRGSRSLSTTF
ncbi:hypothetical protein, partial [Mesorhizobium sp.]|uniref:hypothetical protein n=1 Tax=Mesorhizobium sp. TaxID=1871066 RepID=UPI0025E7A9E7